MSWDWLGEPNSWRFWGRFLMFALMLSFVAAFVAGIIWSCFFDDSESYY